jgi:LacI family transcriptional regulator, repressor for deo operon, udp, cdd, tsx, nupC, and nupG
VVRSKPGDTAPVVATPGDGQRFTPRPKVPTARDVALLAGVSQSTVSRVLNDTETRLISVSTSQRVRAAAVELGYSPHPLARALRGKHTHLIGLIVREIEDPFFARFISHLSIQARELGYQIVLGHAHSDPNQALQMTAVLETRHCDGVLLLGDLRDDGPATTKILKDNRAVVALCRGHSQASVPTINSDNRAGMALLLEHLYALGHRRMAFVTGGWLGDLRERQQAYQAFWQLRGLPVIAEYSQTDSNDLEGGYRAVGRLLALPVPPTAVLAADDIMAIGVLKAVTDAGLRLPRDISVTGFDGIEMSQFTTPALTTVRQPVETMSRQALQLLMRLINNESIPEQEAISLVQPELVVRQSSGAVPQAS